MPASGSIAHLIRKKTPQILIVLTVLVALWQLTFYTRLMKWDIMDITLPWRHLVSECIRNGVLPFWNPYMNGGFPQMGDGSTWYPIAWILGLFRPYTPATIQYEFLLHLILAGLGLFKLMRWWKVSTQAATIAAIYFALNGFMIGNAQHLGYAAGAAWLPWLLYLFDRYVREFRWTLIPPILLVSFCLVTGVYPGIIIVTLYVLLCLLLVRLIQQIRSQTFQLTPWLTLLPIGIGVVAISAVLLLGVADLTPLINRTQGLSFDGDAWGILTGSLPWKAALSILFPLAVTTDPGFWGADLALLNCFSGGLTWIFVLIGLVYFKKMPRVFWVYLGTAIFFYMTAMAEVFPIRKALYLALPLMDLFRFSTLFRMFAIFFMLLAFTSSFDVLMKEPKKVVRALLGIGALFTVALLIEAVFVERWMIRDFFLEGYFRFNEVAGIRERIYLEQFLLWIFMGLLWWLIRSKRTHLVIGLVALEIILFTQLNVYSTVIENRGPADVEARLKEMPTGFPNPDLNQSLAENNDISLNTIPYLWKNLAIYQKVPTIDGCSPYGLTLMDESREKGQLEPVSNMPLFFTATVAEGVLIPDTIKEAISIVSFQPNEAVVEVQLPESRRLVFNQNFHQSWEVRIDGVLSENQVVNTTYNSVDVSAGKHQISYHFNPSTVRIGFFISLFMFLGAALLWIATGVRQLRAEINSEKESS